MPGRLRSAVSLWPTSRATRYRRLFPTRGAAVIALVVCVLAPALLVGLQIDASPGFSPIDEAAHLDYVDRVARGELPRQGEHLLDGTLRELACRGIPFLPPRPGLCTAAELEYWAFPGRASQYEAQQPPTYYVLTVPLRWAAREVLRIDDRLDATRAANVVWLVAGLLFLWAAGRLLAVDPAPLGAALLLLAGAPTVVYGTSAVSNDVTAVPAAGLVALVAAIAHGRDGRRVPLALFGAGFAGAACKTTNLFPVVAVSALFAVAAIHDRAPGERWTATLGRWSREGGALLAGGAAATGIWTVVHRSLALIDLRDEPAFAGLRDDPHDLGILLSQAAKVFQPLTGSFVPTDTLGQGVQQPFTTGLGFLLVAAALGGLFVSRRGWPHALGLIIVPTLYAGGVGLGLGLLITYETAGVSARYGLSLAPLLILVLAASLRGGWSVAAVAVFAVASFSTTLAVMAT
jgi:hypothetical protein